MTSARLPIRLPCSCADAERKLANVVNRLEHHLANGRQWLIGESYPFADMKCYSMMPDLQRLLPELGKAEAPPHSLAWLERMTRRPAVTALENYARGD